MNPNIRNILFILILISSSTLIFAQQIDQSGTLPDTILIASEPDYPPYCIVDQNGEAAGFSVDLFKAAAAAVGLNVKIKVGVWNRIKQELAEGKLDALPLVGRTPEREPFYDFTMPYLSLHGAVFVRKGTKDINSLEDLKNKSIVVMKGDNAEEFVRREKISDKIYTTHTFEEAFRELADGRYDAVVTQRIMGIKLLEEIGIKNVEPLDFQIPEFRQDFCFAVRKGNTLLRDRLNEGLSIVMANDTYQAIHTKWFGPDYKEKISPQDILKISLYLLVPLLIIMSLAWIFFLRREVRLQTESLNAEIANHNETLKALRKSEEKYRSMIMNLMEGFYSATLDGKLLDYNVEFAKIFNLDPTKDFTGTHLPDFWHNPEDRENYVQDLLRDGVIRNYEVRGKKPDGTKIIMLVNSRLIRDDDGKPLRIDSSFMDITDRKKAVEELHNLKSQLEETVAKRTAELQEKVEKLNRSQKAMLYMVEDLNKMTAELQEERQKLLMSNQELEAFTYSVSHDLRAPLRGVSGFANILLEDYAAHLDDEGRRVCNVIMQSANKMGMLIDDLLTFSRLGRREIRKSKVDMADLVNSVYFEITNEKERERIDLKVGPLGSVVVDAHMFKQVWINLLSNAIKFSSKRKRAKIRIGREEQDGEPVYFIKDNGAGFDMKYADKLFHVFQRLHSEREFEGTGVGLANVQRIILRHGGKIWGESQVGKGAAFYFTLPIE